MQNNIIPVAIVINNNYAMQASVVIASIIANKLDSTFYSINIITDEINNENKSKLFSMATLNVEINIHELGKKYEDLTNNTRWPNIIFYKFDIPYVLKQYNKIILLDADTIVLKDLSYMYNITLKDNYAGVVNDITRILRNDTFIRRVDKYFNIGSVLLNSKKIREDFELSDILNCYKENHNLFLSPEQDTLNYLFGNRIVHIHPKYQYITLYNNYRKKNFMQFHNIKDYKELNLQNLVILHFAQMRPWFFYNLKYGNIWDEYYKTSPFYKTLKKKFYNPLLNIYRKIRYNIKFFKQNIGVKYEN